MFKNLNLQVEVIHDVGFSATSKSRADQFADYLKQQVEDYRSINREHGSQIDALKSSLNESHIFDVVYKAVAEDRPQQDDELAVLVAQASAEITKKFVESKRALSQEESLNLEWVEKYWNIKIKAVQRGELSHSVFIARTPSA